MTIDALFQLVHGDAADMAIVRSNEADLVYVHPPYFSESTESLLRMPVKEQKQQTVVRQQVLDFAESLRPVFREVVRILRAGGAVVLQTADLRYGGRLLPLAAVHRGMLEELGLVTLSRVLWVSSFQTPSHWPRFRRTPRVGLFRTVDSQEFFVMSTPDGLRDRKTPVELDAEELKECIWPCWKMPGTGRGKAHPYQSPPAVVRRFIELLTLPGDLVVDPFAGGGQILKTTTELGRRAVGYEIDPAYMRKADARVQKALEGSGR